MNFRPRLASFLTLLVLMASTVMLHAQAYTSIVVFGDSLSDTGNFAQLSQNSYAIRIPGPLAGYTDGRFTDGKDTSPAAQLYTGIWIEQLAAQLAAKPVVKASLNGGTDYAYGSATNAAGTQAVQFGPGNALTVTVQNVGLQIATYLATNPTITANTLFVVWGGANDLLQASTGAQIVAAANLDVANVQTLINAGATNIIIPNLPPLGLIPRLNGSPVASATATAGASVYNQVLAAGIAGLPAANPGKTLRLFGLDTFSLLNALSVAPASASGLVNVTKSSQILPTVNPDTYLFWDDLHPTTAGHNLVGKYASNLFTQSVASTSALSLSTANAVPGQSVTLKAVVTPASGTAVPTGLVTYYAGSTPLVTATLDATGTATAAYPAAPVAGSPYSITAQYLGDATFSASTSAAQTLKVLATPVATTLTVTSSSIAANLGASVTITATATSLVGAPTNSVTFFDGTTVLATTTLSAAGTATYTSASFTAGSHTITAVTTANATFAGATSAAITEVVTAPAYTITATPASLTVTAGTGGATTITLTPVGGYTGTFNFACGTLPAHASCTFNPASLVATGNNAASTSILNISTYFNATVASASPVSPSHHSNLQVFAAFSFLPCLGGLALVSRRRRQLRVLWLPVALAMGFCGTVFGTVGCSSSPAVHFTPAGTYQIPVVVTSVGATVQTINVTLIVQ